MREPPPRAAGRRRTGTLCSLTPPAVPMGRGPEGRRLPTRSGPLPTPSPTSLSLSLECSRRPEGSPQVRRHLQVQRGILHGHPGPGPPVAPPGGGGDARAPALAFLPQRRAPASPCHVPRGWKQPSASPKSSFSQGKCCYLPLESSLFSPKPSKKSNVSNSRELKRGADRGAGNGSPQRTPSAWAPPRHVKRHL